MHAVTRHTHVHAGVDQGAEGLGKNGRKSVLGQVRMPMVARARGVEWHERIDADHQVAVGLQGKRGMHCAYESTVDIMLPVDLDSRIQAGEGGASNDRLRDRNVFVARVSEYDSVAGVEVGCDDIELGPQLAKVVRVATAAEQLVLFAFVWRFVVLCGGLVLG